MSMLITTSFLLPRNIKGAKWINSASYISDADRREVMRQIELCRQSNPAGTRVGVRCPCYIGEPHPIATVEYQPPSRGSLIWNVVYHREG